MRMTREVEQKRLNQMAAMLHDNGELRNVDIQNKMKKLTGSTPTSRTINKARQQYEKSKAKFSDGRNKEMKNGATARQTVHAGPEVRMSSLVQPEGEKAFREEKGADYVTDRPKGKSGRLTLDEAVEKAGPSLRNLRRIAEACPAIGAFVVAKSLEDDAVSCHVRSRKVTEETKELELD